MVSAGPNDPQYYTTCLTDFMTYIIHVPFLYAGWHSSNGSPLPLLPLLLYIIRNFPLRIQLWVYRILHRWLLLPISPPPQYSRHLLELRCPCLFRLPCLQRLQMHRKCKRARQSRPLYHSIRCLTQPFSPTISLKICGCTYVLQSPTKANGDTIMNYTYRLWITSFHKEAHI